MEKIPKLSELECGKTDSGDYGTWQNFQQNDGTFSTFPLWPFRWDKAHEECVYRKCAAFCPDGTSSPGAQKYGKTEFEYEGEIYEREWYCCDDKDMCNGAHLSAEKTPATALLVLLLSAFLLLYFR